MPDQPATEPSQPTCCNCDAHVDPDTDNVMTRNDELYCEACHDEVFSFCDSCEEYHPSDEFRSASVRRRNSSGQMRTIEIHLCEACFDNQYTTCDCCSASVENDTTVRTGNEEDVCQTCYEDNYFTCEDCGETLHNDAHDEDGVCTSCRESNRRGNIRGYSTRVETDEKFGTSDTGIYYGVELEVESKHGEPETHAERVNGILGKFIICKEDGSLQNGFEIVTAPATIEEHKKRWTDFFAVNWSKAGLRSWDTTTCGLHVHVSRRPLSELTIAKVLVFINSNANKAFIHKIAGRKDNRYAITKPKTFKDVKLPAERYEALNLCNRNTIEFRIFKGTLKRETFFKAVEFCDALIDFCLPAQRSLRDCQSVTAFISHVEKNKKKWPNLFDFLKNRMPMLLDATDLSNSDH